MQLGVMMRPIQLLQRLFFLTALFVCISSTAQPSGLFFGGLGSIAQSEVAFSKDVDNTHPDNPTTVAGRIFQTTNEGDGYLAHVGATVGLRHTWDSQFLSVQLEVATGAGRVSGFVPGAGISSSRAQYGEAWPETFEVSRTNEIGLVAKWGRSTQMNSWTAISGWYVLLGARFVVEADFELRHQRGCYIPSGCEGQQFQSGSFQYEVEDRTFQFGAGLEHTFNDRLAAQLELRIETPFEKTWVDKFENDTVLVGHELELTKLTVSLNILRFF